MIAPLSHGIPYSARTIVVVAAIALAFVASVAAGASYTSDSEQAAQHESAECATPTPSGDDPLQSCGGIFPIGIGSCIDFEKPFNCDPFPATPTSPTPTPAPVDSPTPFPTPDGVSEVALDVDARADGVQDAEVVNAGVAFAVTIYVTRASAPFAGYQWEVRIPLDGLEFVGAVEHADILGTPFCAPPVEWVVGLYVILDSGGCTGMEPQPYVGATTTLTFRCLRKGTLAIEILDQTDDWVFGSMLITSGGGTLTTLTHGATVKCAGEPHPRVPANRVGQLPPGPAVATLVYEVTLS